MSDPTQHATPNTPAPRARWLPSYQQLRLGVLMTSLVLGITGMSRNDERLVKGAIVVAVIGVVMRFFNRPRNRGQGS